MTDDQAGATNEPAKAGCQEIVTSLAGNQMTVLDLLRLGKSVADTARAAGISRMTIYRWLKDDAHFRAAYNQWMDEMAMSCRSRMMMMTEKALATIERAIDGGDARMAMQLLNGAGRFTPAIDADVEAADVERRRKLERKRKRIAMEKEDRGLDLDDQVSRWNDAEIGQMVGMEKPAKPPAKTAAPAEFDEMDLENAKHEEWLVDGDRIVKRVRRKV
jgi:AcrR family transcriptional regulator